MATIAELSSKLDDLTKQVADLDKAHEGKMFPEDAEKKWKELGKEIDSTNAEYAAMTTREKALAGYLTIREKHADNKPENIKHGEIAKPEGKTEIPEAFRKAFGGALGIGDMFIKSPEFKTIQEMVGVKDGEPGNVSDHVNVKMRPVTAHMSYKALMTSAALSGGELLRPQRLASILEILREPLRVTDLLPTVPVTGTNSVEYVAETAFTNNAAIVPEATSTSDAAANKPESEITFDVVTDTLDVIAHWIPATRQILADAPQLRALIENRLRIGLLEKLEANVVADILAASGLLVQAVGTDTKLDALYKGAQKVRVTGRAVPEAYVIHPNDFTDIRLAKDLNGNYLMGAPSTIGVVTVWGLPVIDTQWITENTGLVADFSMLGALYEREQIQTYVTDSHSDFFIRNLLAILMEMRAAVAIYRATAGCKVTGL